MLAIAGYLLETLDKPWKKHDNNIVPQKAVLSRESKDSCPRVLGL